MARPKTAGGEGSHTSQGARDLGTCNGIDESPSDVAAPPRTRTSTDGGVAPCRQWRYPPSRRMPPRRLRVLLLVVLPALQVAGAQASAGFQIPTDKPPAATAPQP